MKGGELHGQQQKAQRSVSSGSLETERWTLKNASTEQLVTELSSREGVASYRVEPYQFKTVTAEGPALVFIVTD